MIGLRGHDSANWKKDAESALDLDVPSITTYPCRVHPTETPKAFNDFLKGASAYPDVFEFSEMYANSQHLLVSRGYSEGPSFWFTKPDSEYKVNMQKWGKNADLVGLGSSIHAHGNSVYSWVNGWQCWNKAGIKEYMTSLEMGKLPIDVGARLSTKRGLAVRNILFGVRISLGVEEFRDKYGLTPFEIAPGIFERLGDMGLYHVSERAIKPTSFGHMFSEEIINYLHRRLR
jgi:coproporphyrinogen III oxidase-like Fe-S oxidoreductase